MATGAHKAGLLLLCALVIAGCYNPSISEGGFSCADSGKICPDGFQCDPTDHRCRTKLLVGDASTCSVPPANPLCDDQPASGQSCNPACQVGCTCGRCEINSNGDAVCVPGSGAKTLGKVCTVSNTDDCAPGLSCVQEACGNLLGRCYQTCDNNGQCIGGGICQVPILIAGGAPSMYHACDIPPQTCDPVMNMGCPSSALNCYVTGAKDTRCDCPNSMAPPGALGAPCMFPNDCMPTLICIANVGGLSGPHCHPLCNVSAPICPAGKTCIAASTGTAYGYCGP